MAVSRTLLSLSPTRSLTGAGAGLLRELYFATAVAALGGWLIMLVFPEPLTLLAQQWPVFVVAIAAATVANATAVGGGFVFMPLFTFGYGLGAIESLKLALSTQAFGMTSGAINWSLARIRWRILMFALGFAITGMIIGSYWLMPPSQHINLAFGVVSLLLALGLAIELLWSKGRNANSSEDVAPALLTLESLLFGSLCLLGGMINAWVSIGIGEVVAIWMLLRWKYPLAVCVSTGVAALAGCSIAGLLIHTSLGGIRWDFLAFTAPGVVIGGRLGARLGLALSRGGSTQAHPQAEQNLKLLIVGVIAVDGVVVLAKTLLQG